MISVICVYNDKKILDDWLIKSLKNQTVKFELITVDNIQRQFRSAAEALNYGGKKITGKYLMFVHQDVDLSSNVWLEDAEKILESIPNLGVAGVAGKTPEYLPIVSNIKHGIPPQNDGYLQIQKLVEVQTLDECLIIIPKPVFERLRFDEQTCDNWHLYAVDYCLSIKKSGLGVYVLPMFIYHRSVGVFSTTYQNILSLTAPYSKEYYQNLGKLLKKHRKFVKRVYTTTGNWYASYPLISQRIGRVTQYAITYLLTIIGIRYFALKSLWERIKNKIMFF